jgi:hypothetical protein
MEQEANKRRKERIKEEKRKEQPRNILGKKKNTHKTQNQEKQYKRVARQDKDVPSHGVCPPHSTSP